jgi:hypothetical protein
MEDIRNRLFNDETVSEINADVANLDVVVLELDDNHDPVDPQYAHWILDWETAPRATDKQIKAFERIFGCLEQLEIRHQSV